jgi:hypothetical protein
VAQAILYGKEWSLVQFMSVNDDDLAHNNWLPKRQAVSYHLDGYVCN